MKNILWIHVDAFRNDTRKLILNREGIDLPGFKLLDDNFIKFSNCYSHAISTIYSVAGYLTGTFPFVNTVLNNDTGRVPNNIKWIGEILREKGYTSKAFITTGPKHDPNFFRIGIHRCFDEVEFLHSEKGFLENQMPSDLLYEDYGKDIVGRCNEGDKYFTYITLLDMHVWNGRDIDGDWKEYYNQAIKVSYFLENLIPMVDLDKTIVLINGDHGWKFAFDQEERKAYYGFGDISGYEPLIKVSAYISEYMDKVCGNSINSRCRLVDLVPSVLNQMHFCEDIPTNINGSIISEKSNQVVYSEIGMIQNPNRKIVVDEYIKSFPNSIESNLFSKMQIPSKNNFSLLFDDYQIMFGMNGYPYGLFKVEGGMVRYDKNLISDKETVLRLCEESSHFIKENI